MARWLRWYEGSVSVKRSRWGMPILLCNTRNMWRLAQYLAGERPLVTSEFPYNETSRYQRNSLQWVTSHAVPMCASMRTGPCYCYSAGQTLSLLVKSWEANKRSIFFPIELSAGTGAPLCYESEYQSFLTRNPTECVYNKLDVSELPILSVLSSVYINS